MGSGSNPSTKSAAATGQRKGQTETEGLCRREKEAVKKRNKGASIYDVYTEGGGHKMHQICGQIEYIFCGQRGGEGVNKSPSPVDVINGSP